MDKKIQNLDELKERVGFHERRWDEAFIKELDPEGQEGKAKIQLTNLQISEGVFRYVDKKHLEAIGEL